MNGNAKQQIFQTNSPGRWQRFKWGWRIVLFFLLLGVVIVSIALRRGYVPSLPRIKEQSQLYKKVLDTNRTFLFKNSLIEQYGGFRKYINEKVPYKAGAFPGSKKDSNKNGLSVAKADTNFRSFTKFPTGIRAAFYVDWDAQSFLSLQQYISHMNLVIPEWIFIDPTADTLFTNIDDRAWTVMKNSGVKIMPILSNNFKEVFRGDAVHRIINDPVKKERLIHDLIKILVKNRFIGVNVDFEELQEQKNEKLVEFQRDLYDRLHAQNFLVTQDVIPFNEDYNFSELSKYNDYIFLMAYDQYSDNTGPGPIAHQKWIEGAVDDAVKKIPVQKLILGMAAYGYDWKLGKEVSARTVSYQQALFTAKDEEATVDFDNNSYNLHYTYVDEDDNNTKHEVQFMDAASMFNTLRFATEYGLAGSAIWRLGDEDTRVWEFYDKDMRKPAISDFDFAAFSRVDAVDANDFVDYEGSGEVLDIIATPTNGRITPEVDTSELLISEETYDSLPSKFVARKYGTTDSMKLVLTFDDGPDPNYTPKILDILSKYHVPAAFFVVGINAENNIPIVKREFKEGHEIGNHTFTHPNIAKVSQRRAILEMEATRLLIECITGHSTIMFRAPYNADFEPEKWEELIPVAIARKKNYLDIGESIDPLDWEPGTPADSIYDRVIRRKDEMTRAGLSGNIILLHDAGGDGREETVKALPRIIESLQARGFHFTTVSDILGKTKDEMMPPVPKGSGYYLLQINYYFAELGYWGGHILFSLFIVFMVLGVGRVLFMAVIATREYLREKKEKLVPFWLPDGTNAPLVSIIVPAYNEEINAVGSLESLMNRDYPNFEIIFVDDGSTDNTYEKVSRAFADNPKVKVFTKPNGGKASALNFGIQQSEAEFVVCIDADTKLLPDAVSRLMEHFAPQPSEGGVVSPTGTASEEFPGVGIVGAVAGNVKVGNRVNLLTRWQSIEYISSQNFDRKAFAFINAITVVPGAIGAFRKSAIMEAGGFTTDTLAEDCDLTIRILRCGYIVANDNRAIAMTEAPETLKQFFKQRFRWSYGVMQTFWKNRDALFNWKYRWLGYVALPNILIFQYIIPFIIPLADFFMIVGLLTGNASKIAGYYLVFMLVDLAVAVLAFSFEREKISRLVWLIPQRLIWRWLMWYVLFRAVRRAFKGELQHWGVLKRTGNVKTV